MRKRDAALQVIAVLLAFGVGILAGKQCQPEPEVVTETVTVTTAGPERVVYQCPPDAGVPEPPPKDVVAEPRPPRSPKKRELPAAAAPISPRERQQLLGWVRDQSVDLDGCRTSDKATFRLAVTLELGNGGEVARVRFNAPPRELPSDVQRCLRDRMTRWSPPSDLVKGRKELVFGLTF